VVRPELPAGAFQPVPSRLAWLALHVSLIAVGIWAIAHGWGGWPGMIAASLVVGHSFAGCAFVGHETLHGAVVRNRTLRYLVGWVCFAPFCVSPRLWIAWHNRVHHGNTMIDGIDPDSFPTLATYRSNRLSRIADLFSLGYRRVGGIVTMLFGFTGQSQQVLWRMARPLGYLSHREHLYAVLETLGAAAMWTTVCLLVGGKAVVFAFVIPLAIGNLIVVSYILTNHSLSPLNDINDPLLNSLSVTVPRFVDMLHLNFGFHVEHHLFPAMSSAHAPAVRDSLVRHWPERYQSMPLLTALWRLATTPRVYRDATTLVDPASGRTWPTLHGEVARDTPPSGPPPERADELVVVGIVATEV
jgi:fatty acid desaturase